MVMPSAHSDTLFEELLQDLPPQLEEEARRFKAFCRGRRFKTVQQLLRAVLIYCGVDHSLRTTAGNLAMLDTVISDEGLRQRLSKCGPWLKAILPSLLPDYPGSSLPASRRWIVVDTTSVKGPGAKAHQYRVHLAIDMVSFAIIDITITDKRRGETLKQIAIKAGDVVMADRGYSHRSGILDIVGRGGDVIVRHNYQCVPLHDASGATLDLVALLAEQPEQTVRTIAGWLQAPGAPPVQVWLHAYRLSAADAAAARRKCRLAAKKHGRQAKQVTLILAGWVLVLTTLAVEEVTGATVLQAYRCRWQIELVIKRFKSILAVDGLRGKEGSQLSEVWLYGKMVYVLLIERRARRRCGRKWESMDSERQASWWRIWQMLKTAVMTAIVGVSEWQPQRWADSLRVMQERGRKRRLQSLSKDMIAYITRRIAMLEAQQ